MNAQPTMGVADTLRAKMIGEALLRELAALPRGQWHKVEFVIKRNEDGGVLIDDLKVEGKR